MFHEVQFPPDISYGSSGGPEFATDVVTSYSGYEQRNINWAQARCRFNVASAVKCQEQLDALLAFFYARHGQAYGFRYKDWPDYSATDETIGTGDGVTTEFSLQKTYNNAGYFYTRPITKPVSGSIKVYVDGIEDLTALKDTSNGTITLTQAPSSGQIITSSFEFDVPVRFNVDHLSVSLETYGASAMQAVNLVEIRT